MIVPTRLGYGFISLAAAILLAISGLSQASKLRVFTEEYPPVSFETDGKAGGLGSEVVEEIERRVGEHAPIQVIPWARGYKIVSEEANVALFATMRTPERETLFKWVGPLTTVTTGFYARHGSSLHITNINDARTVDHILVPREYYSHQVLRSVGFQNLDAVNSPEMMVRMLLAGHGALMATDNLTLPTLLTEAGASGNNVELLYNFMKSQNYIAFSRATKDDIVQSWQRSLDDMKRDGSFARIYEKWLPGNKPPDIEPITVQMVAPH